LTAEPAFFALGLTLPGLPAMRTGPSLAKRKLALRKALKFSTSNPRKRIPRFWHRCPQSVTSKVAVLEARLDRTKRTL
jgi:hypothetical protein